MKSKDQADVFESLLDAHANGKKKAYCTQAYTSKAHIQADVRKSSVNSLEFITCTEVKGTEIASKAAVTEQLPYAVESSTEPGRLLHIQHT